MTWAREALVDVVIPWSHYETAGTGGEVTTLIAPVLRLLSSFFHLVHYGRRAGPRPKVGPVYSQLKSFLSEVASLTSDSPGLEAVRGPSRCWP